MKKILVVGDTIIDRHWYCTPKHISPEAPILTWEVEGIIDYPGGAANVVNNLWSLCKIYREEIKISFVSHITKELLNCLPQEFPIEDCILSSKEPTIKNRIIFPEPHQQIIRFDQDSNNSAREEIVSKIGDRKYDIGLVSDYSHGEITDDILQMVRECCSLTVIDPKGNDCSKYIGKTDVITPNLKELSDLVPTNDSELIKVIELSRELQGTRHQEPTVVLKRGNKGCLLYHLKDIKPFKAFKNERPFLDPTGAGDTFIATLVFYLATGKTFYEAAEQANRLAGVGVTFPNCWVPEEKYVY